MRFFFVLLSFVFLLIACKQKSNDITNLPSTEDRFLLTTEDSTSIFKIILNSTKFKKGETLSGTVIMVKSRLPNFKVWFGPFDDNFEFVDMNKRYFKEGRDSTAVFYMKLNKSGVKDLKLMVEEYEIVDEDYIDTRRLYYENELTVE